MDTCLRIILQEITLNVSQMDLVLYLHGSSFLLFLLRSVCGVRATLSLRKLLIEIILSIDFLLFFYFCEAKRHEYITTTQIIKEKTNSIYKKESEGKDHEGIRSLHLRRNSGFSYMLKAV